MSGERAVPKQSSDPTQHSLNTQVGRTMAISETSKNFTESNPKGYSRRENILNRVALSCESDRSFDLSILHIRPMNSSSKLDY